jgi:hypothetical protein
MKNFIEFGEAVRENLECREQRLMGESSECSEDQNADSNAESKDCALKENFIGNWTAGCSC